MPHRAGRGLTRGRAMFRHLVPLCLSTTLLLAGCMTQPKDLDLSLTRPTSGAESEGLLGWWPDSRSLLETRAAGPDEPPSLAELWRLPLDGTTPQRLGVTGTGIVYASIAPDARRIAYSTQTFESEVWLLKAEMPH